MPILTQYTIVNDADQIQMVLSLTDSQFSEILEQLPVGWDIRPSYNSEK